MIIGKKTIFLDFFGGGGRASCPPSPTPMVSTRCGFFCSFFLVACRRSSIISDGVAAAAASGADVARSSQRGADHAGDTLVRHRERGVGRPGLRQRGRHRPLLSAARQLRSHDRRLLEELRPVQLPLPHHQSLRVRRRVRYLSVSTRLLPDFKSDRDGFRNSNSAGSGFGKNLFWYH